MIDCNSLHTALSLTIRRHTYYAYLFSEELQKSVLKFLKFLKLYPQPGDAMHALSAKNFKELQELQGGI